MCKLSGVLCSQDQQAFMKHMSDFNLNFNTTEEFNFRFRIFSEIDRLIQNNYSNFTLGHNLYSTWT